MPSNVTVSWRNTHQRNIHCRIYCSTWLGRTPWSADLYRRCNSCDVKHIDTRATHTWVYYEILYIVNIYVVTWLPDRNAVRLNSRDTSYPKRFAWWDLRSTRNCRIHYRKIRESNRENRSETSRIELSCGLTLSAHRGHDFLENWTDLRVLRIRRWH